MLLTSYFKTLTATLALAFTFFTPLLASASVTHIDEHSYVPEDDQPKNMAETTRAEMNFFFSPFKRLNYNVRVRNVGTNDLKTVTIRTKIEESVTDKNFTLAPALKTGESTVLTVNNILNIEGLHTLSSAVCKANGVAVGDPVYVSTVYGSYDNGFPRIPVIEEKTATHDGWCPKGIVSMEFLHKRYPEWICISVHDNDPMTSESYGKLVSELWTGTSLPQAVVNRTASLKLIGEDPEDEHYKDISSQYTSNPAFVSIFLDTEYDDTQQMVMIHSVTEMSLDGDTPLGLAFAIVEDGVGPYDQKNSFADDPDAKMGGWELKGDSESILFNNVARHLEGFPAIEGSLPEEFEAYVPYEFECAIPASCVDNDVFRVVGMVVNTLTGEIMNADQILVSKSAINEITDSSLSDQKENDISVLTPGVKIFYPDGRKVVKENAVPGIYILEKNGRTKKVIVK